MSNIRSLKGILFVIMVIVGVNANSSVKIVTSIKPIHSIVVNLTKGVSEPKLLLDSNKSAHNFHLRPAQIKAISVANLVIIISPDFEIGLQKILANMSSENIINISKIKGINIINNKHNELIKTNENEHEHEHEPINYHLWTDIDNMQIFAKYLAKKLTKLDAKNADIYNKNLVELLSKLTKLKINTSKELLPYKQKSLSASSNAFNYFTTANGLNLRVVVTNKHDDRLSIYKVLQAKKNMQKNDTYCLLNTTEIPKKQITILTEGLNVKTASIDIIGANINKGLEYYFALINLITNKTKLCLQ